jgi:NTE family protein
MKNRRAVFLLSYLIFFSLAFSQNRPKVGLVLSGGGARGFAHIGTLKLIDSLQIPIDYIAGTSMGGTIGALYSIGYSGKEIEQIARTTDWLDVFSDNPPRRSVNYLQKKDDGKYQVELGLKGITPVIPSGFVVGQKVSLMLSQLTASTETITDFDQLPIPFRCVAIDLISGHEVVLSKGSLPKALRATMSIPTIFSPVEWGDSLLIDGGFLNNFPADVAESMGADVIIGVNIGNRLSKKEDLQSLVSVFNQTMVIIDYRRQQKNFEKCALVITPDLDAFSSTDLDRESVNEIIDQGEKAATANFDKMIELIEKFNLKPEHSLDDSLSQKLSRIASLNIRGDTYRPDEYFFQMLKCRPGEYINKEALQQKIKRIKNANIFKQISLTIIPSGDDEVKVELRVADKENPIIYGISIVGNNKLPFNFIYRLLGFNPNQRLDKAKLNKRINEMYGLGYFEDITYEIIPVKDQFVRLKLHIREKATRKLRIGLHYDNYYKIVGYAGLQATNLPMPGFRTEATLQFAGLLNFDWSLAYPSRSLDLPIYPFVRFNYRNIPVNLYDNDSGDKAAEYNLESTTIAAGLGFRLGTNGILQAEYNQEYMHINPNIAGLDTNYFPSWNDKLRNLYGKFTIDLLDDIILPRHGVLFIATYDVSLKSLGSALNYQQMVLKFDMYHTFYRNHAIQFGGFYTNFSDDLPVYKYVVQGGPTTFVGMKYDQIEGDKFGYGKLMYRYEYKKDIFLKLITNFGFYNLPSILKLNKEKTLIGYGIGLKFLSIIGPLEFIISNGSKSINQWDKLQTRFYFTAGVKI